MNKLIVSTVSSVNEFASGYPELVSVVIDGALASRILKVAALVKEHGLLLAELNEFGAVWSDCDEDTALETLQAESLSVLDSEQQAVLIASIEAQGKRMDAPLIRVFESGFMLAAVPRHCGDDMALHTPTIPLEALDNPDYLFNEVKYS